MAAVDAENIEIAGAPTQVAPRASHGPSLPDFRLGLDNLLLHKLRSLLTMLGIIFGVAAVVSMLSIGAGAQQQVMAFIEQLGIHNVIIEAKEITDPQAYQQVRQLSAGLTFRDYRVIVATVGGIRQSAPRKRFTP
jgi:putative ABC transport system permease protein